MPRTALRIALLLLALTPAVAIAQKNCVKGKPCGNTCIARNKTCHVGAPSTRSSTPPPSAPAPTVRAPHGAQFVASSRGQVYYWVGCSAWKSLSASNLRFFATRQEATAAGYRVSGSPGCAGPADPPAPAGPPSAPDASAPPTPPLATAPLPPSPAPSANDSLDVCIVERVIDGDTFTCDANRTIRMLLIDAPESNQGPFGAVAKLELKRLLPPGAAVGLESDVDQQDRYGRVLAYVLLPDGRLANEEMLRSGMAVVAVYPPNVHHVERFRAVAESAKAGQRGLWATSAFECLPADQRAGRCR